METPKKNISIDDQGVLDNKVFYFIQPLLFNAQPPETASLGWHWGLYQELHYVTSLPWLHHPDACCISRHRYRTSPW